MARILVAGEAILDFAPANGGAHYEAAPGGSAFNTARALGALGADAAFAGAVSRDDWGARFRAALREASVDCALLRCSAKPMPLALVSPEGAAGPSFTLYLAGTAHEDALPPAAPPSEITHLHVSSFHACAPPTGERVLALMRAARGRASISFDPNVRPGALPDREEAVRLIEARVRLSDIVKASVQDMDWLYPGRDPMDSMAAWSDAGPRLAILTQGPDGAAAFAGRARAHAGAAPAAVVDTIGAGDVFMAALLAEMAREQALGPDLASPNVEALGRWLGFAAAAASWTCARRGAQAPARADLAAP